MCFYHDYDWQSSVYVSEDRTALKDVHCEECGVTIKTGEQYRYIFGQESECCLDCENLDCECPKDEDGGCIECKCDKPNFGESFDYCRCMDCHRFIEGVAEREKAEGCKGNQTRPSLGEMIEEISQFEIEDIRAYFDSAKQLHPELETSGYLQRLWGRIVPSHHDESYQPRAST